MWKRPKSDAGCKLSPRERDVIALVAEGHPAKTVAHMLGLHGRTVENYIANIKVALGARNIAHAVAIFVRQTMAEEDARAPMAPMSGAELAALAPDLRRIYEARQ
jgi:DNA-binding CsgD family transcriptional regulator